MMTKIGILGSGHVGSTLAQQIVTLGLASELVLIDPKADKVAADVMDLQDMQANLASHTRVFAGGYADLKDADIVVSAFGNIAEAWKTPTDRFAELPFTKKYVEESAPQLKASGFHGVLVVISNPCDVIASLFQRLTGFDRNRVLGTGTLLDSSRMKRATAAALDIDPRSVDGYSLGEHGNSQFVAWSTVRVLGRPIQELLAESKTQLDLDQIDHDAKMGGHTVFLGKRYTNFGIAAAASRLLKAIIEDAHEELPVSNYYAPLDCYLGYPAIIGKQGIVKQLALALTDEEKEKLERSADFIKDKTAQVLGSIR
ncbi:MAG: L-lactate dehydrogenase [Oenococcus sp.]|uniref:L-lactate dehydrogenase n=1 Tax=Oenococcus sp. TaxID=1979414 RepID=UPI0039E9F80C